MHAKSFQLCLTICDLIDYSPPGFSVNGILQARIRECFHFLCVCASLWSMKVSNIDEVKFTNFFLLLMLLVSHLRVLCWNQGNEDLLCFWVNFCMWSEVRVQFHSSGCSYPDVPVPFYEEIILSWLKCFGCLLENQLGTEVCVHLWTLSSILLVYMSVLVLVPHCLDYHCFVINSEFGMCVSYSVLF